MIRRRPAGCEHGPDFYDRENARCVKCPAPKLYRPDFLALAKPAMDLAPSAEELQRRADREEIHQREVRLRDSGIRGAILDEDFEWLLANTLKPTHALDTVRRWYVERMDPRPSSRLFTVIALTGLTGRGKTLAAGWLISRLGGRYVTAESLRRLFVSTHFRDTLKLEELLNTRVMAVDEAGGELEGNSAAAAMLHFVNLRAGNSQGWSLITANLPKAEFCERYGERTVRRIEHQGAIVEVSGEDLRRKP